MFGFIKKIKNLFSGKNSSKQKNGSKSRPGKDSKSPSRPNIPPSRDHEFKRSRPGSQEPRQGKKQERNPSKNGEKKQNAGTQSPMPQNGKGASEKPQREGRQRRQASDKPNRRDGFTERRERRERYADRKNGGSPESSPKDAEVKISPELVLTEWNPADFAVEPEEGKKRFHDFNLPEPIMHAVYDLGFKYCTPIQAASLEKSLAGANVAGRAQTGTGKTAAYLLTILTRYLNQCAVPAPASSASSETTPASSASSETSPEDTRAACPHTAAAPESSANAAAAETRSCGAPRALVIAPTRELCVQIANDARALGKYCGLRSMAVFGGMDYARQARELQEAPLELLAATPGRLLDFQRQHIVDLSKIDTLVIDEADRMLDMGFIPDVRRIIRCLPAKRQTLLYSATLDDNVMRLASQWMPDPVKVEIEPEKTANQSIDQKVFIVTSSQKFTILCHLLEQFEGQRVLVFGNRRASTDHLADQLRRQGYECELLSGDVSQAHRMKVLDAFRDGSVKLVVATDVAGRGLHIADIGLVVNFELPYEAEDYVHRIGRTGRAGKVGTAVSFADEDESFIIPDIETYIGEELKCTTPDDALLAPLPPPRRRNRRPEKKTEVDKANQCAVENEESAIPAAVPELPSEPSVSANGDACSRAGAEGAKGSACGQAREVEPQAGRAVCPHTAAVPELPSEPSVSANGDACSRAGAEGAKDSAGGQAREVEHQAASRPNARAGEPRPPAVVMPKGGMRSQVWSPGQK